jgi:hypothetical protein
MAEAREEQSFSYLTPMRKRRAERCLKRLKRIHTMISEMLKELGRNRIVDPVSKWEEKYKHCEEQLALIEAMMDQREKELQR